ncbi:unnamed protein product [Didymodactylos carnosus]|uniref:ADP ribosyltransferase domain-containing protein n=1 Tax=Didymodactylos carnosus TaxID=1234261 RepID=A0A8S2HTG5_9BILA|nr:unnamed protein product [Didymodactylos carnosus]CAF3676142.1 unnamed protein product [Didymodactylos carnosus]
MTSAEEENLLLCWLENDVDDSVDSKKAHGPREGLDIPFRLYHDQHKCAEFIRSVENEKILLVVSGTVTACPTFPTIHSFLAVDSVFIFSANAEKYAALQDHYPKIVGIYIEHKSLFKAIRRKIRMLTTETVGFSLFDRQKEKTIRDLSKHAASFLWYQLLLLILKKMPHDHQARKQMLEKCSDYNRDNQSALKKIDEFCHSYVSTRAIDWYIADSFLYRTVNKALRTEDIDLLYLFRFYIQDLCAQLEGEWRKQKIEEPLTVYRAQKISREELDTLKNNVGVLISTNGFISTSRCKETALEFIFGATTTSKVVKIFIEIIIDPSVKSIIFADIDKYNGIDEGGPDIGEQEVLISLGAVFTIDLIEFDSEIDLWRIKLTATDEGTDELQEYMKTTEKELQEISPTILFGRLLLYEMGQVEKSEKYFHMLMKSLPSHHEDVPSVYDGIGNVHRRKGKFEIAMENYKKAYELRLNRLPSNDYRLGISFTNIGNIQKDIGDYDNAMSFYEKALAIYDKAYSSNHRNKAQLLNDVGSLHKMKGNYDTALKYTEAAYEMFQRVLPENHPRIASVLGYIGSIYEDTLDYNQALEHYHLAFGMEEKLFPGDHPNLMRRFDSIISLYKKKEQLDVAMTFCQEKLALLTEILGEDHVRIGHILEIMGDLLQCDRLTQAISYYSKAVVILRRSKPVENTAAMIRCFRAMSLLFHDSRLFDNALNYNLKALNLQRKTLPQDLRKIAEIYQHIGLIYQDMKDYSKSLDYFEKGVSICSANYGENDEQTQTIRSLINTINIIKQCTFLRPRSNAIIDSEMTPPRSPCRPRANAFSESVGPQATSAFEIAAHTMENLHVNFSYSPPSDVSCYDNEHFVFDFPCRPRSNAIVERDDDLNESSRSDFHENNSKLTCKV